MPSSAPCGSAAAQRAKSAARSASSAAHHSDALARHVALELVAHAAPGSPVEELHDGAAEVPPGFHHMGHDLVAAPLLGRWPLTEAVTGHRLGRPRSWSIAARTLSTISAGESFAPCEVR